MGAHLAEAAKPMRHRYTRRALFSALLVALCLAASNLPLASSQTDSCSNGLSLGSLVPFNTTGLDCFQAWPSQDFILRFGKAAANNSVWSFVLSAPDSGGYISIGFSPTGRMVGSSAVAGWATSSTGAGSARQYYLGGTSSRSCPPDQGKLALARGAAAPTLVSKGSRLYLAFQLAGQPLTDVVYAVGPSGSLPGSNGLLPQHQDMASGTISLSGGSSGGSPATGGGGDGDGDGGEGGERKGKKKRSGEDSSDGGDDGDEGKGEKQRASASTSRASGGGLSAKRRHGVLAAVSWGAMIPIGVALARFLKRLDPFWFYAHVVAQGLGSVLGVVAIVAGFKLDDDDGGAVAAHKAVGVVVLVGACLQLMALLARPAKETKARRYWNWYHHNVGRAAVVLGVANIFYGLSIASERQEWSYVYGVIVGLFAVACLVLEEWRRRQ